MLTKIRLWKMIGLYVITLGIYGYVWLAIRRNEINKHYKLAVPHWAWMIIPPLVACALVFPLMFVGYSAMIQAQGLFYASLGIVLLTAAITFFISLWWMWQFGRAVEKITRGKVPLLWTILYWILLGPITFFMHQYYFNRLPKTAKVSTEPKYAPSKKFIVLSIILIVISFVVSGMSALLIPASRGDWTDFQREAREVDYKLMQYNQLTDLHKQCVKTLDRKYPGPLAADQQDAYDKDYDTCEAIRLRQNKAADDYNKAIENW